LQWKNNKEGIMELETRKLLRWWALVRWFMTIVMFSIGILHINFYERGYQNILFFGAFVGIIGLNLLFHLQSSLLRVWTVIFQIVLDLVFATILVHLTGGLGSSFVWVYLVSIITASLTVPKTGGVMAGLVGSLSLLTLIVLYRQNVLATNTYSYLDMSGSTIYILSYTGLFCGVALIASYLGDQLGLFVNMRKETSELTAKRFELEQQVSSLVQRLNEWENLKPALNDIAKLDHDLNTPLCVISLSLGRITKYGIELQNEGLQRTGNEITEAMNRISQILLRLDSLKKSPLIDSKKGE